MTGGSVAGCHIDCHIGSLSSDVILMHTKEDGSNGSKVTKNDCFIAKKKDSNFCSARNLLRE
jgi:hypothetical protein